MMKIKFLLLIIAVAFSASAFCLFSCADEVELLSVEQTQTDSSENVSEDDIEEDSTVTGEDTDRAEEDNSQNTGGVVSGEDSATEEETTGESTCVHNLEHVSYVAATCVADGNEEYWYCAVCGGYFLDADATKEVTANDIVIPADGSSHTGEWVVASPSSCIEAGELRLNCTSCGKTFLKKTEPSEHSYGEWVEVTPATCVSEGKKERKCKYCNEVQAEIIEKLPHEYEVITVQEATCTEQGQIVYKCVCGEEYIEYTEALGHELSKVAAKEPTCKDVGWEEYETCSRCGYSTYIEIPATGQHSYSSADGITYTCENCGYTYTEQKLTYTLTYELTSDGAGYIVTGLEKGGECTDLVIPDRYCGLPVTEIAANAFSGNTDIITVTIGNNVTAIGVSAFYGCTYLTSLYIPESLQTFGIYAFSGCTKITEIYYNAVAASVENFATGTFRNAGREAEGITLYVGASVTKIPANLFSYTDGQNSSTAANITQIVFAEDSSLQTIGSSAFAGCNGLRSVYIPPSCTNIYSMAFAYCTSLTYAEVPKTASVSVSAFSNVASDFKCVTYSV